MVGDPSDGEMRRHSSLVAAGIGLSRVSGLARDAALAYFLGANAGADAFRAALKIPNFLQNLLGEGVLSASFIPSFSRLLADGRDEDAGRLAGAVLGMLIALTGVLVLLGVLLARPLTLLITPGFEGDKLELTVTLVRIMFPGIGLLVISAWCLGVLNSHRRFFLSYVAPVVWNAGILAALFGHGATLVLDPAIAAGWGVLLGGGLQVAVQVPTVRRLLRGSMRLSVDRDAPGVRGVLRAFLPIVLGRGTVQLAALLDVVVASLLATGALAVLGYAQTLYLLPIALFGMSVAAAELPSLSVRAGAELSHLRSRLDAGLARSAFFVIGTSVGYLLVGGGIVALLFGRGEFDQATVVQVSLVLGVYALGLLPATASRLLQSLLYAVDDARTPARIAVIRVTIGLAIAVPLMFNLDQLVVDLSEPARVRLTEGGTLPNFAPVDPALRGQDGNQLRLGALGLAIGSAFGAWLEFALLRRAVGRRLHSPRLGGGTLARLLAAAVVASAAILVLGPQLDDSPWVRVPVLGVVGGAVYVGVCAWRGVPEARELLRALPGRRGSS